MNTDIQKKVQDILARIKAKGFVIPTNIASPASQECMAGGANKDESAEIANDLIREAVPQGPTDVNFHHVNHS